MQQTRTVMGISNAVCSNCGNGIVRNPANAWIHLATLQTQCPSDQLIAALKLLSTV